MRAPPDTSRPHGEETIVSTIEESVIVNVPVRTAYNQWTQFEEFPQFMSGVEKVEQLDDTKLHWIAEIAGKRKEWDAEITEQIPDERVAWTATTGAKNAGVVTFHRISDNETKVMLQMEIDPEGPIENVGDVLGFPDRQVNKDLDKFKEFIEARGQETGAWRGEVQQDATGSSTGGGSAS
jgi:uncharacterized membrane protein